MQNVNESKKGAHLETITMPNISRIFRSEKSAIHFEYFRLNILHLKNQKNLHLKPKIWNGMKFLHRFLPRAPSREA